MFEDRSRRRKNSILVIVFLVIFLATVVGLFFNTSDNIMSKINNEQNKINSYQVPENLIKPQDHKSTPVKEITNIPNIDLVTPNTVLVFEVNFELCGHSKIKRSANASDDEINLSEEQMKLKYKDWQLISFESEKVVLRKVMNTYCPNHFIIGVKGEGIAVYKYNIDGQKVIINETDIRISTLTPEDQEIVSSGIVADTEDELQGILEGFSD